MKLIVEEGKEDRAKALEAYTFFKAIVDESKGEESDAAKKCMVDCLKLARESRLNAQKIFDTLVKIAGVDKSSKATNSEKPTLDNLLKGYDDD